MGFLDDVGSAINQAVNSVVQTGATVIAAPFEFARDAVTGRPLDQAFGDKTKRLMGAAVSTVTDPMGLMSTDAAQGVFRNKDLNTFGLGYFEDYAGTVRGARDANAGYDVQQADWNSASRFVVKSAAIGIASAASGAEGTQWHDPNNANAGAFGAKWSSRVPEANLANYGTALAVSPALARGDLRSIAGIVGIKSPLTGLLPSNPVAPVVGGTPRQSMPASSSPSFNPFSSPATTGSYEAGGGSSQNEMLLVGAAAVLGAIILARSA